MTMDVSFEAPSDGKYKPTSPPAQTITLSNLSFIAESPNENEADLVEIRHKLRFEADSKMSVMTILKLFLEQLMLLDSHAYLLSKDTSRHFQNVQDLPTIQSDLQKLFPATILHRRSGNRIVLRLTIICSKTFNELNRLGLITWANHNHLRLEDDIYLEDDVRDCLWIAGRDSYTSKPHLHEYLTNIITKNDYNSDEQQLLQAYTKQHSLKDDTIPSFSIYFRNRVTYKNLPTKALIIRCDATICPFFVKFLTRANSSGMIPIKKGSFIPLAVTKHNEKATISAMDLQNKYLSRTVSIPIIGLSFESLQSHIDVEGEGKKTIETLIYENCLSVEPTSKSQDLGRFNLICFKNDEQRLINYIETDFPMMWRLLPTDVATAFSENLKIDYPRLTSGFTGATNSNSPHSVTINDPQSISQSANSNSESDNQWTKPPKIRRPPPFVSVIYNETASQAHRRTKTENKSRTSSTKSQTTSDMSTLVSDLRDEVVQEFKEHAQILSTLRNEIAQLRQLHTAPVKDTILSEIKANNKQEAEALRQEITALETQAHNTKHTTDIQELVTQIVQSMVPLIITAVRESMTPAQHDHPKRSRIGATPTHLKIVPTNLMNAYPPDSPMETTLPLPSILLERPTSTPPFHPSEAPDPPTPVHSPISIPPLPSTPNPMLTPAATKGDEMEE